MIIINYILEVLIFCTSFLIPFGFIFDDYGYSKFGRLTDVLLVCLMKKDNCIFKARFAFLFNYKILLL
jgi:hypothetical protein